MNINEMIEVMQAYRDGKEIEGRRRGSKEDWLTLHPPMWEWFYFEYRVKKQPRTLTLWRLAGSNMEWRVAKEGPIHPEHETMVVQEVLDD